MSGATIVDNIYGWSSFSISCQKDDYIFVGCGNVVTRDVFLTCTNATLLASITGSSSYSNPSISGALYKCTATGTCACNTNALVYGFVMRL